MYFIKSAKTVIKRYCDVIDMDFRIVENDKGKQILVICPTEITDKQLIKEGYASSGHSEINGFYGYAYCFNQVIHYYNIKRPLVVGLGLANVSTLYKKMFPLSPAKFKFVDISPTLAELVADLKLIKSANDVIIQDVNSLDFEKLSKEHDCILFDAYGSDDVAVFTPETVLEAMKHFKCVTANIIEHDDNKVNNMVVAKTMIDNNAIALTQEDRLPKLNIDMRGVGTYHNWVVVWHRDHNVMELANAIPSFAPVLF